VSEQSIKFHPDAVAEARAAFNWYNQKSPSAALAFVSELDVAIERISHSPLARPEYVGGTRRYLFRQFPFALVYRATEVAIEVIAIAHGRRKPGYWRDRLSAES